MQKIVAILIEFSRNIQHLGIGTFINSMDLIIYKSNTRKHEKFDFAHFIVVFAVHITVK